MSGYGLESPGANRRITETGAVNVPLLRHCPQVKVSSVCSIAPLPPIPSPKLTVTIVSHSRWTSQENGPAFSRLQCDQGLASLPARLRKGQFCATRSGGGGSICHPAAVLPIDGYPPGTPRAPRSRRRGGEPARRRRRGRRRRLLRAARR